MACLKPRGTKKTDPVLKVTEDYPLPPLVDGPVDGGNDGSDSDGHQQVLVWDGLPKGENWHWDQVGHRDH